MVFAQFRGILDALATAKVRVRCRAYVFLCADSPVVIGPWDGLAGFIKRTLRRRIIDGGLVLQDERDVYREIQKLCGELKCEGKVDYWNVDWLESSDITRPVANATDITKVFHRELKMGLRKLFHFSVGEHAPATAVTSLILQQFTCGCSKCANFEFDSTYQVEHCTAHKQLCGICHLKREDNRGVVAKRAKDLQASLELARKLPIGDIVALETGDFRRTQREGGGSQHGFLLARVLQQEERGERKAYRVAGDRAMRTFENEAYRQGDVIILLRLLDRDDGDNTGLTFKDSSRIYLSNFASLKATGLQLQAARGRAATAAGLMQLPADENRRIEAIVAH